MMRSDFSTNNKNSTNLTNKKADESLQNLALILHPDYTNIHIALTNPNNIISQASIHKHEASKNLLFIIDNLLKHSKINLTNLSFLSAQIGPGPFTTLRVVLSTLNGLAYATNLPLIGVDGLEAFIKDQEITTRYLIIILNAFCNDVYFAIYDQSEKTTVKGCASINNFLMNLENLLNKVSLEKSKLISKKISFKNLNLETLSKEVLSKKISFKDLNSKSKEILPMATCIGNGLLLHEKILIEKFGSKIFIPEKFQEICSLESIRVLSYESFDRQEFHKQLLPIYLKDSSTHLMPSIL
jgi:tRNA threonylcarbamoyladenosine biosynthesis protein TsaB